MASINASTSGAGGVITTADATGILNLQTASTTAVTVDASQRVGIGTASPGYLLNVSANGGGGDSAQFVRVTDTNTSNSIGPLHLTIGAANHFAVNPSPVLCGTNGIAFGVGDGSDLATQRKMTIDSNGHLLIGTTNTAPRDFTSGGGCVIKPPANTFEYASSDTNPVFLNYTGSTSGSANFITFRQQGAGRGTISTNGSTTSYNTGSDYRLKENIAPMTGALDKVAQLKPVTFTWKETGNASQGFIAHELQAIVPDCVTGEKDAVETYIDEDGIEQTKIKPQGVDASFLVATLTAAIQEQQTIINDLKARIEVLEAK